jgi:dethiobiotin synthetase
VRPRLVAVVTGTGTEIGKTWLSAGIIERLRDRGLTVAARKPAQSFVPGDGKTDAELLGAASGEPPARVCSEHRSYPVPMAPPIAAVSLGARPPVLAELSDEITSGWPDPAVDVGIVEGAGGVASPIAVDGDTADLAKELRADVVVLVADAGLGTINSVRLSCNALAPLPVVVYLNRFDPGQELHTRNLAWLSENDGLQVSCDRDDIAGRICAHLGG